MEPFLEDVTAVAENILRTNGYPTCHISGGYVAGKAVMLSLSNAPNLAQEADILSRLAMAFNCPIAATGNSLFGVILLDDPKLFLEGEIVTPPPTINILDLIEQYEATNGR